MYSMLYRIFIRKGIIFIGDNYVQKQKDIYTDYIEELDKTAQTVQEKNKVTKRKKQGKIFRKHST